MFTIDENRISDESHSNARDKIMQALSHCAQALKGKDTTATDQELRDL
jgi:hypothetical protein